jgi:uncharacterized protein YkwD
MRFRPLTALTLALLLIVAAAPSTASAASPCANANALPGNTSEGVLARATVCLVNRERTRRGMRALRTNKRLSRAAVAHTRDMIDQRYFEHVAPTGQNVVDRLLSTGYLGRVSRWLVGENLAWGIGSHSSPHQIVVSWMNSPGHRRNMLNRRFREIGIGVVFSTPVRNAPTSATYTTTFGSRR